MARVVYFWSLLLGLAHGCHLASHIKDIAAGSCLPKDGAGLLGIERGVPGCLLGSRALGGNSCQLHLKISSKGKPQSWPVTVLSPSCPGLWSLISVGSHSFTIDDSAITTIPILLSS